MLREKIRKAWNIAWLCIYILSYIPFIYLGYSYNQELQYCTEGIEIFALAGSCFILAIGVVFMHLCEIAIYFSGRYFMRAKNTRTIGKTVWHILFPLGMILLLLGYLLSLRL